MTKVLLINKPFNVLCQFTDKEGRETLSTIVDSSKYPHYYPAGRLDYDSEGLVILTNDGALQERITHPKNKFPKSYWAQVEGLPSDNKLKPIEEGLTLKDGLTKPAAVRIIDEPSIWTRDPPIRSRKNIKTSWIELTIVEGKNRQVRRMTAAIGFPTLRLIRFKIGLWDLNDLSPGTYREEIVHLPKAKKQYATNRKR